MLRVNDLGEYAIVKKILRSIGRRSSAQKGLRIIVPPGDDALGVSFKLPDNACLISTTDVLVEDSHFRLSWERSFAGPAGFYRALGYKSLSINLSDLAAMGAIKPLFCLIGLSIPVDTPVDNVNNFYKGFLGLAAKTGIFLGGGDTNSSKKWVISVTAAGIGKINRIIKRDGARLGDGIYSTGYLGDSAAGLKILNSGKGLSAIGPTERYLINRHLLPPVRMEPAKSLSSCASAMIDCSDGLYNSVMQICEASGAGAEIYTDKIPVSSYLKKSGMDWLDMALYGGEDYELIFTSGKRLTGQAFRSPASAGRFSKIGKITQGKGITILENKTTGKTIPVKKSGYQHFSHNQRG